LDDRDGGKLAVHKVNGRDCHVILDRARSRSHISTRVHEWHRGHANAIIVEQGRVVASFVAVISYFFTSRGIALRTTTCITRIYSQDIIVAVYIRIDRDSRVIITWGNNRARNAARGTNWLHARTTTTIVKQGNVGT
jgi:hypothetical protein